MSIGWFITHVNPMNNNVFGKYTYIAICNTKFVHVVNNNLEILCQFLRHMILESHKIWILGIFNWSKKYCHFGEFLYIIINTTSVST